MKRLTQKQSVFYQLYKSWESGKHEYIPVFEFMGEVFCKELDLWGYVSHECNSRACELNNENPNMLEFVKRKARAGGRYYCWRIKPAVTKADMLDSSIIKLHNALKTKERNSKPIERCPHGLPKITICTDCPKVVHSVPTSPPTKPYVD